MKNFNNKKGQAAMEFLMTYGWAILAAVIVIGALGSYFYFNNSQQDMATISGGMFYAEASRIASAGVQLGIKNSQSIDVNITGITVKNKEDTIECQTATVPGILAAGKVLDVTNINADGTNACASLLTVGDSFSGTIVIDYTKTTSAISLQSTGTISGTVAA